MKGKEGRKTGTMKGRKEQEEGGEKRLEVEEGMKEGRGELRKKEI